ncbi:MAG: LuxR C-terminal-related transcriptional regulator [Lautropia sp.]
MRRWRVTRSADALAGALVCEVMSGVGTPHLAANCLAAVGSRLPATFCTVYAVGASGRIETVSAASRYGNAAERTAALYVKQRFDRCDPHMKWLAARKLPRQPQRWIGHHRGDELRDAAYRAACYDSVGIRERASLLLLLPSGQRAAMSFYRSFTQPEFGTADFAFLEAHAAILGEALVVHSRSALVARGLQEPVLGSRMLTLSLREREVVGQLLAGRTAKEAARALGVEPTTLRTHQYRAFRRLGIRTLKDLLRGTRSEPG